MRAIFRRVAPHQALVLDFATGITGAGGVRDNTVLQFSRLSDATHFGRDGLMYTVAPDVQRFDHDPLTFASRGLLIEGQTTNSLLGSEDFSGAGWVETGLGILSDQFVAPTGAVTMDQMIEDNSLNSAHSVRQNIVGDTGLEWSLSVFVRPAGRDKLRLRLLGIDGSSDWIDADVDLATETATISATSGAGSNGVARITKISDAQQIWRVSVSGTPVLNGGVGTVRATIYTMNNVGAVNFDGDGASGLGVWGAQLEQSPRLTSYIPTSVAPVTRAAENADLSLGSWFNAAEGSVMVAFTPEGPLLNEWVWSLNDTTISNRIDQRLAGGGNTPVVVKNGDGNALSGMVMPQEECQVSRSAFAFADNDFAISWNGDAAQTDSSGTLPTGLTQFEIGQLTNPARSFFGTVARLIYYPARLPETDLQLLSKG